MDWSCFCRFPPEEGIDLETLIEFWSPITEFFSSDSSAEEAPNGKDLMLSLQDIGDKLSLLTDSSFTDQISALRDNLGPVILNANDFADRIGQLSGAITVLKSATDSLRSFLDTYLVSSDSSGKP